MNFNLVNWQQKQAMDAYADQREVEKARAKAIAKEQVKMQAREYREVQKEQEAERKKAVHEEIQILQNGKLQIITKNLRVNTEPREVTNMEAPRLILLKRRSDESDTVLLLKFKLNGCDSEVFFNPEMIGSGTYLLKKFASQGVRFYLPMAKKKAFLIEFVSMLIEDSSEEHWLADNVGWVKDSEGHFEFVGEEDLRWSLAKKISEVGTSASALFLVDIMAEIRPLLEDAGLMQPGGLIVFSKNIGNISEIKRFFRRVGAVQCEKLTVSEGAIPNNKIGFHVHQKYDKEEPLLKFLAEGEFTPAVLIHSFIPEHLKESGHLIVLEGEVDFEDEDIQAGKSFKEFIHQKPEFLENSIKYFKNSEFYMRHKWDEETDIALEASAKIYGDFYRLEHTEAEAEKLHSCFRNMIGVLLEREERFSGEWDVLDAVKKVVENYLEENQQIEIGSKDAVEGKLAEANQKQQAILWDDEFYYFPEKVFRYACGSLLEMVSFLEIKREMAAQGFLRCNKISDGNYTVKKTIINAYSCEVRQRFIAIRREFFDREGALTLAERRETSCALELPAESPVE